RQLINGAWTGWEAFVFDGDLAAALVPYLKSADAAAMYEPKAQIYEPVGASVLDLEFPPGSLMMEIQAIVPTAGGQWGRFSSDGTTFYAGASDYGYFQLANNASIVLTGGAVTNNIPLANATNDAATVASPHRLLVFR